MARLTLAVLMFCCCSSLILGQLVLQATLRDFAPATMAHARYPAEWWSYNGWTNYPTGGGCGTANGGMGFNRSDFELPLWEYGTIRSPNAKGGILYNGEKGLVGNLCNASNDWTNCGRTDENRKPVYAHPARSPFYSIKGPDTFNTWFNDSPQSKKKFMNITLQNIGGRMYKYENLYFFPFDDQGWTDWQYGEKGTSEKHNYGYCLEIHGHFSYQGGETFYFTGDDDVWVYLDSRLVIDLGGIHTEQNALVKLDDIKGLKLGTNYKIDFFYCERHSTLSKLAITTSIEIACTYYDWCDICEGDGQSCCTADKIALCDDKNMCTLDKCAVIKPPTVECVHETISCDDGNACTEELCDPKVGCVRTNKVCNDNDACTIDSCNNATGCVFTKIDCNKANDKCITPSCDKVTGCKSTAITCDDGSKCTTDSCDSALGCQFKPIDCDDNNACTIDTCDKATGCKHTDIVCDDKNACTKDSCDPVTGCKFQSITCNDNDACTTDTCDKNSGCVYTPIKCDDGDVCTVDKCDKTNGCTYTKTDCNDNNACTTDSCDKLKGCQYKDIVCDDKDKCTTDSCDKALGCVFAKVDCDDGNACTIDSCDKTLGCQHKDVVCNDNNACTKDTCDTKIGCKYEDISNTCNDNDACTTDTCVPASGCKNTALTCNDNNACTDDSCDKVKGCQFAVKSCEDGDPCTNNTCDVLSGCKKTTIKCDLCLLANGTAKTCAPKNGNKCTPTVCNPDTGACVDGPVVVCNDNNLCTSDACIASSGLCNFTSIPCDDGNACTIDKCDPKTGCASTPMDCNDKNPCTTDSCSGGKCVNTPVTGYCVPCKDTACTYTDVCNPKVCDVDKCVVKSVYCNDTNLCTTDSCVASGDKATCKYDPVVCDTSDPCAPQSCDAGTCKAVPVLCDDSNPCTVNSCKKGTTGKAECVFTAKDCPTTDLCNPVSCNLTTGACVGVPVLCNDGNPCTIDSCAVKGGAAECVFTPKTCDNTDLCNPQTCNITTGTCQAQRITCDDGNVCTNDKCDFKTGATTYECVNEPVVCDDATTGLTCYPAVCDPDAGGCVKGEWLCDDNNPCTTDKCVSFQNCSHVLTGCDDGDACTVEACDSNARTTEDACTYTPLNCSAVASLCFVPLGCDKINGCLTEPVDCPEPLDWCQVTKCDENVGCLEIPRTCLTNDADCYVGVCDSEKKECRTEERPNFATITSGKKGGVTCYLAYNPEEAAAIITAGAIAGIVIGAVVFAALAALGARQAYLWMQLRGGAVGGAHGNPLYQPNENAGQNPLFAT